MYILPKKIDSHLLMKTRNDQVIQQAKRTCEILINMMKTDWASEECPFHKRNKATEKWTEQLMLLRMLNIPTQRNSYFLTLSLFAVSWRYVKLYEKEFVVYTHSIL